MQRPSAAARVQRATDLHGMADIFLSYTEKDREQARRLAAMLESVGWSVWWDRRIPAGDTWRNVLQRALESMRCMVVLWSSRSIESEWVYEEATEGRRLGKLVPVLIEAVRPPAGFREIQAADLTRWDGSRDFEGLRMLIADLESLLGKPAAATPAYDPTDLADGDHRGAGRWPRGRLSLIAAAAVLLATGAGYVALSPRTPSPVTPSAAPAVLPQPASSAPAAPLAAPSAPVLTPAAAAPTEKPPAKAARPAAARATTTPATRERCADLLYKTQLGEPLSDAEQAALRKECQP